MAELGEMLGFSLQGRGEGGGATATATATLVELLRERMSDSDRLTRRRTFKVRLGFNGLCGATWGFGPSSNMNVREDDDEGGGGGPPEVGVEVTNAVETMIEIGSTPACAGDAPAAAASGMNLAAALAAEREFRATVGFSQSPTIIPTSDNHNHIVGAGTQTENGTPYRVSLMKLLEETDGCDEGETEKGGEGTAPIDSLCCVCMGRKKGAAFIPCGHTFCRVCSRELWLNRGLCPLCNRSIVEVLDIF